MNLVEGEEERDFQRANVSDEIASTSAQSRRHAINAISIRIQALSRAPAISCSRLDLKPDRNSSFYRGDSFPPARAKQTATLLLVRETHSQPPAPSGARSFPRSMRVCAFRALVKGTFIIARVPR